MLLPCQFLVLLMSVSIMVDSSPQRAGPCPQDPGKANGQDTIFPECDYGTGGTFGESIDVNSRIGSSNSNSNSESSSEVSDDDSEGSDSTSSSTTENISVNVSHQTTNTVQENKPTQAPLAVSNGTVSGRNPGCTARPNPGECRGAFPRYFFNEDNDQCDCFLYGGCDEEGITYTWLTLVECHEACVPTNKESGPGCQRVTLEEVTRFLDSEKNPANNSPKNPVNDLTKNPENESSNFISELAVLSSGHADVFSQDYYYSLY